MARSAAAGLQSTVTDHYRVTHADAKLITSSRQFDQAAAKCTTI